MTKWIAAVLIVCAASASASTNIGERIVRVMNNTTWLEEASVVEISASYVFTGDASVVLRLGDEPKPINLTWGSDDGFQLLQSLPHDFSELEGERPREPQATAWRLRFRQLKRPLQIVKLETFDAGAWQVALETEIAAAQCLQHWVAEQNSVLIFGLAGEVLLEAASVDVYRDGSLLLVR
jgi:hypothetical protein